MKCDFYFGYDPLGRYREGICIFDNAGDYKVVVDYCEGADLLVGPVVGNSFSFKGEEFDPRVIGLIELLKKVGRFVIWSAVSTFKGDIRYFCVVRRRAFSAAEIQAAAFFSNVEWGDGVICAGVYVEDGVICKAESFDKRMKAGAVSVFGGGFLVRNEVRNYLEECALSGVVFRDVRFDVEGFMHGQVWEMVSDIEVGGCLLPWYGTESKSNGLMYEVFQYDDAGILPVQLRFGEAELRGISGWDFVAVKHEVPSVRWSTAHSFVFSKRMVEVLGRFRGRYRWSPVVSGI